MRPTRLELAGFGSWIDPVTIDFADVELFALTGDTGAGKSTLLDAICFALYGNAPRHGKRGVEPLINRGLSEARVRLDFLVNDEAWTATRVVKRKPDGGATTKEARLERLVTGPDGDRQTSTVIAGAKDVSDGVVQLLGLSFEHFTTSVLLPQGRFQAFLHDTDSGRQDLLIELLRLGIFEDIQKRANQRASLRRATADNLRAQLDERLATATDDHINDLEARLATCAGLLERRANVADQLERLREDARSLGQQLAESTASLEALRQVAAPADLAVGQRAVADADAAVEAGATAVAEAERALAQAESARSGVADVAALRDHLALLRRHEENRAQHAVAVERLAAVVATADEAAASLATATELLAARRAERDEVARHDHAAAAAAGLVVGDACPVCARPLDEPLSLGAADLTAADAAIQAADATAREAAARANAANAQVAAAKQTIEDQAKALADDERLLADARLQSGTPDQPEALTAALAAAEQTAVAHEQATRQLAAAQRSLRQASDARKAAADALREHEHALTAALASLAARGLDPPSLPPDAGLADAWEVLMDWTARTIPAVTAAVDQARAERDRLHDEGTAVKRTFLDACTAAGIDVDPSTQHFDEVTQAHARAEAALTRARELAVEAAEARTQLTMAEADATLAAALGEHLRANKFEKWLMGRVLRQLTLRASNVFHELSEGAFSLRLDDAGSIEVVDHASADLGRSVQSLSGGETFLASLALALAMAEEVAHLATDGAARLDALFIDEGFGTLDSETLDTVAAGLANLQQQGRMIGVVTHVRDLAEQLPVQFEITKVGAGSRIRRMDEGRA